MRREKERGEEDLAPHLEEEVQIILDCLRSETA